MITTDARPTRARRSQLNRAERAALGKQARTLTPLASHAEFEPARRRNPLRLLREQATTRVRDLVPIRYGRMVANPFAYYRGAALPMSADLSGTPVSGLRAQLCGDAHLANFGMFASPERQLVFDINDFDETLPGPFEWDVKRLAASFTIAGRQNGFDAKTQRRLAVTAAWAYRAAMREFADRSVLQVWYARLTADEINREVQSSVGAKRSKEISAMMAAAQGRDSAQALRKLTTEVDGQPRFVSAPPTIVPLEDLAGHVQADELYGMVGTVMRRYQRSLPYDRRHLVEEFRLLQVARKVVGVGSVGQRTWAVLMRSAADGTPLLLQAKEAQESVLAQYCGQTAYANQGERVVAGQRLMQAQSDIFLGWTHITEPRAGEHDFYVRQLRDWKLSVPIERMRPPGMTVYARLCGWTLARAHARSGDRVALAAYLGRSDRFDQAIADFAVHYADQNDRDHAALRQAVDTNAIPATEGV